MLELIVPLYSLLFGLLSYHLAKIKNRNPLKWLLFGFLTGFIAVIILLILSKNEYKTSLSGSYDLAAVNLGGISSIEGDKNMNLKSKVNAGLKEVASKTAESGGESEKNQKCFEEDFVTCPNCRIVNPIENEKCAVCGMQMVQK
jgi:hypothetical protein